jgi:hypothetical protein
MQYSQAITRQYKAQVRKNTARIYPSLWKVPKSEVQWLLNQADADAAATLAKSETGGFSFPAKKTGGRRAKPTG